MPTMSRRRPWGTIFAIAFWAAFWAAFFGLAARQDARGQAPTPTPDHLATQVWAADCCGTATSDPECAAMLGTYRADFLKARLTQAALTASPTVTPTVTVPPTEESTPTFEAATAAPPTPTRTRPRPTPTWRPAPTATPTRSPLPTPCPTPRPTATPSPEVGRPAAFLPFSLKPRPPRRPTP